MLALVLDFDNHFNYDYVASKQHILTFSKRIMKSKSNNDQRKESLNDGIIHTL